MHPLSSFYGQFFLREFWTLRRIFVVVSIVIAGIWFYLERFTRREISSNLFAELLGVVITVVIVDWINEKRQQEIELAQLVRQLNSPFPEVSTIAFNEIEDRDKFRDGSFRRKSFVSSKLIRVGINYAQFRGARFFRVEVSDSLFFQSELYNVVFQKVEIHRSYLLECNFRSSIVQDSLFQDCSFEEVDFSQSNLWRTSFYGCRFNGSVDFVDAFLEDVSFQNTDVGIEMLENARKLVNITLPNNRKLSGREVLNPNNWNINWDQ